MKRLMSLLVGIIFLSALPALAQDTALTDDDIASIQLVADAIGAVQSADTYRVRVQQNTSQQIDMMIGKENYSISSNIAQTTNFHIQRTDDGLNAVGTIEQNVTSESAGSRTEYEMAYKMVLLDEQLYIYMIESGLLGSAVPDGWINLNDDRSMQSNPYFAGFNAESVARLYNLSVPFDENSIIAVETLDEAEIDGQTMQVFRLEYDPLALLESDTLSVLGQSFGSQFSSEEAAQLLEDMFKGAEITYTAYVGDDGYLYRLEGSISVDTTLEVQGFTLPVVMVVESTSDFSHFNEPLTIKAPVVES